MSETTRKPCNISGCERPALPFSEPPRCSVHIDDLDSWYVEMPTLLEKSGLDQQNRTLVLAMVSSIYKAAVLQDPLHKILYKEYKNEVDPRDTGQFQFESLVNFVIVAAASGIIGNLAYDALKEILKKVTKNKRDEAIERFDYVITEVRYERLRIERHGEKAPFDVADDIVIREIRTKYHILVERKNER